MDIGPTGWNRASRDQAVHTWLCDVGRRMRQGKLWRRWLVAWELRDVYERGYNHGYQDSKEDHAKGPYRV